MGWGLAAAALGGGLVQGAANYFLGKENLDWQKSAQKTTWEREDNAVQRRAADLEAAGLSKTLAAGGAAQSSGPISTTAPQFHGVSEGIDKAAAAMNMMRMKADISKTYADTAVSEAQAVATKAQAANLVQQTTASQSLTPVQVARAQQEVSNLGVDNARKLVDVQAAKLGIDQAKVDLVRSQIAKGVEETTSARKAELDVVAKKLAIEIDQAARDRAWWDLGIYKTLGYPSGTSLSIMDRAGLVTGNALGNLIRKAQQYVPQADLGAPAWARKDVFGGK